MFLTPNYALVVELAATIRQKLPPSPLLMQRTLTIRRTDQHALLLLIVRLIDSSCNFQTAYLMLRLFLFSFFLSLVMFF